MGDQQQGAADAVTQVEQQIDDALAAFRVEVAGRFIGKQDLWVTGKGPRQGDALLLAAGQLARQVA